MCGAVCTNSSTLLQGNGLRRCRASAKRIAHLCTINGSVTYLQYPFHAATQRKNQPEVGNKRASKVHCEASHEVPSCNLFPPGGSLWDIDHKVDLACSNPVHHAISTLEGWLRQRYHFKAAVCVEGGSTRGAWQWQRAQFPPLLCTVHHSTAHLQDYTPSLGTCS